MGRIKKKIIPKVKASKIKPNNTEVNKPKNKKKIKNSKITKKEEPQEQIKDQPKEEVIEKKKKRGRPRKEAPKEETSKEKIEKEEISKEKTEDNKLNIEMTATETTTTEIAKTVKAPKGYFTCSSCKGIFPNTEKHVYRTKNYCEECYNQFSQKVDDFKKLTDFIYCDIYNKDCNFPLIATQLKRLKEQIPDLTDERIYKILKYAIDYEEVSLGEIDPEWGITNLINKYYYKAKKFYDLKASINNDTEAIKEALNLETKVVVIKRSELIKRQEEYEEERRKRYIGQMLDEKDMEEIVAYMEKFGTHEDLGFK